MRLLLLAALLLPFGTAARAQEDEEAAPQAVQRYLVNLRLGDSLEEVRRIYPPAEEWPTVVEPRGQVKRYRIERATAKSFPNKVEILFLGFKKGRLVEIEAVYDEKQSRAQPVEKLAGEYALVYGESRRSGDAFWWDDGTTVLRVFPYEVPILKDGAQSVAWRTAVQVFESGLFRRTD